jgi:hypothetical protein
MNEIITLTHKGLTFNAGDLNSRNNRIIAEIPSNFLKVMFKSSSDY